jgi:uncharacterized protein
LTAIAFQGLHSRNIIAVTTLKRRNGMKKMNAVDWVTWLLVVVGGLNWGLVGFFKYNVVDEVFGVESGGARVIYALVGLATLYIVYGVVGMMSDNK